MLKKELWIESFDSALFHFNEPWFAKGSQAKKLASAKDFWGSEGPAGSCARTISQQAFHPFGWSGKAIEDYRDKPQEIAQFACFLRDKSALRRLSGQYKSDQEMFTALEAMDISDLIRELHLWVIRKHAPDGDVSFADLSDGERQLLMVLGLIRVSRGKRALFLLDEPDTHLNPAWQLNYLHLIREWTGVAADAETCQIILTSHNPLTIAALSRDEVRVMTSDDDKTVTVQPPFIDPKGLGFSRVLTDIFGMASTLDQPTQELVDERNGLARRKDLSTDQLLRLQALNIELRSLGFLYEERDKLYSLFLRKMDSVELADVVSLTPDEMKRRDETTNEIAEELLREQ